jgi:hypothetical protein
MPVRLCLLVLLASGGLAQKLHELCAACHSGPAEDFQGHTHFAKGLSCDACHGASKAHRDATGHKPPDRIAGPAEQPAVCGACHAAPRKSYESGQHGKLVLAREGKRAAACTTCHGTHSLRQPAAMGSQCQRCHASLPASCQKAPSAVTSKLICANCHDPHSLAVARH